jgi:hypothetical protein
VVNRAGLRGWPGTEEQYVRNAIHRWLHRIETQDQGTTALYSSDTRRAPFPAMSLLEGGGHVHLRSTTALVARCHLISAVTDSASLA